MQFFRKAWTKTLSSLIDKLFSRQPAKDKQPSLRPEPVKAKKPAALQTHLVVPMGKTKRYRRQELQDIGLWKRGQKPKGREHIRAKMIRNRGTLDRSLRMHPQVR